MGSRLLLLFLLPLAGFAQQGGTPAASIHKACVGTPGNTTGAYRQQCQTSAGTVYACNDASGCTTSGQWVTATGPTGATGATGPTGPTGPSTNPITIAGTTNQVAVSGVACTQGGAGTCTIALTPLVAFGSNGTSGISTTYEALTAGNFMARIVPAEAGAKVFNMTVAGFTFAGDTALDQVLNFGWNVNPGGARTDGSRPSIFDSWESHYCPIAADLTSCVMERHAGQSNIDGTNVVRPFTFTVNEGLGGGTKAGQIDQSFTANTMDWNYQLNAVGAKTQYMKWDKFAFNVVQPVVWTFANNNVDSLVQSNAAGNANISMIKVNASNKVLIDSGAAGAIAGGTFTVNGLTSLSGFGADVNYGSFTAIFGSTQVIRIADNNISMSGATEMRWTGTTHAYDTADTKFTRAAAGVLSFDTTAAGNALGSWKAFSGTITGHMIFTGTAPTITSGCGTGSPALDATATDNAGTLTLGTAPGTCILTFATTWTTVPHCVVSPQGGVVAAYSVAATTLTITATGLTGNIDYRCSK